MNRRSRFVAGLITLFVMALSFAEGVWAATCAPEMVMSEASPVSSQQMPNGPDCMPGRYDEQDGQDLPDCPFGPAGSMQGCVPAASLPATPLVEIAPSPEGAERVIVSDQEPDLLLGSAIFHPPKS